MLKKTVTLSSFFSQKVLAATTGAGTTVITLSTQLSEPHVLFYLSVPFWVVILAMLLVILLSSILSAMTEKTKSINGRLKKFGLSLFVGLLVSFIFIPLLEDAPNPSRMMLWAAIISFGGNIIVIIIADVLDRVKNSEDLRDSLAKSTTKSIKNRLKGLGMLISGGDSNDDADKQ